MTRVCKYTYQNVRLMTFTSDACQNARGKPFDTCTVSYTYQNARGNL